MPARFNEMNSIDRQVKNDFGFAAILLGVFAIVVWLLLMPVLPAIANTTMHRFHLCSSNFAVFAAQFPIPAMYNFANQTKVSDVPPGFIDPFFAGLDTEDSFRYINHFPARDATFSIGRYKNLRDGKDHWFTLRSNYRGQELETEFRLKAVAKWQYELQRMSAR
jgi:hypothetical protein